MNKVIEAEIWKPIPDRFPYEASTFGNVRNSKTGRVLVPVPLQSRGHLTVKVGGGAKASRQLVHRLILLTFLGNAPEGHIGCHKNDVKTDNRLENLYWGTYKSNTQDAIRNGKFYFARGEGNGMTKFPNETVKKILMEYTGQRGEQSYLARKYKMSVQNVHLIVHGRARRNDHSSI